MTKWLAKKREEKWKRRGAGAICTAAETTPLYTSPESHGKGTFYGCGEIEKGHKLSERDSNKIKYITRRMGAEIILF